MEYYAQVSSPLGMLTLRSSGQAVTGLWIGEPGSDIPPSSYQKGSGEIPVLQALTEWLRIYFRGENPSFSILCEPEGTDFQQRVWHQIQRVPYGQMMTYGEIARILNREKPEHPTSPRAVGQAVGRNPIPIVIPCHRIIGAGSRLTGYAGGLDKKIRLLRLEGIPAQHMPL